jgi:hypothetical protein
MIASFTVISPDATLRRVSTYIRMSRVVR